jgi:hypothetical protein
MKTETLAATWLGACSVLIALARPAFLLRDRCVKRDLISEVIRKMGKRVERQAARKAERLVWLP